MSRESAGLYTIDPIGCWFSFLNAYTFLIPCREGDGGSNGGLGEGLERKWFLSEEGLTVVLFCQIIYQNMSNVFNRIA